MSEKRRAEIEAKRAKLAELRKARADRQRQETERRQSDVSAPCVKPLSSRTDWATR
jgi:dynein intermediate chain